VNYGRYEIVKELGRGSMGVVYQARDPHIDRLIAVKVMRRDRMENESFVKRFMKEAKVIGRLSHPRVVTIFDVGEEGGEIYIAMEYLEGIPFSDVIKQRRLEPAEIAEFGIQVAETLEYAHRKGVVHRDIKPSNIIIEPGGGIKITDFGIARIEDSSATLQTQAGEIMGTPAYMSPEQVLGNPVDGRSDLFSLGVILYELSAGRRPFGGEGKTLATVFNDIIQGSPQDPREATASIPSTLSGIIMKALEKDPAQRFQSGKEMAEALRACLTKPEPVPVGVSPTPAKRKPNFIVPIGVAVLLAAVLGGGFFVYRGWLASPEGPTSQVEESLPEVVPPSSGSGATNVADSAGPQASTEEAIPGGEGSPGSGPPTIPPNSGQQPEAKPGEGDAAIQPQPPQEQAEPSPQPAKLTVRTTPAGASIHIDGKLKGASPLTRTLPKGTYRIRATLAGYERVEQRVVLAEGNKKTISLNLKTMAQSDEWVVAPLVDRPQEGSGSGGK
jgi:serine/threonine-protein kinase